MTRPRNEAAESKQPADDTPAPVTAPTPAAAPSKAPAPAVQDDDTRGPYEPYPTAAFFHGGRHSPIVAAMGRRLEAEGFATAGRPLGPDWTNGHKTAFAAFQHSLHPRQDADASGIPDASSWKQLKVPRVTPLPKEPR